MKLSFTLLLTFLFFFHADFAIGKTVPGDPPFEVNATSGSVVDFPMVDCFDVLTAVQPENALPVTAGLVFHIESTTGVTPSVDGAIVTGWSDQSAQGNDLTTSGDPRYDEDATPSGKPAIVLDGAGDFLARDDDNTTSIFGFPMGNTARTMFFVVDYEAVGSNNEYAGLAYGKSTSNQAFGLTLNGDDNLLTVQGWGGSHDRVSNVNGVIDNSIQRGFISHAVVFDGTSYFHYLNGAQIANGPKSYNTVIEKLRIGENLNGGTTPMSIAAAFIYNRALSASEFDDVEDYIQSTYITLIPTPVTLADFTAKPHSNQSVMLNWITSSEENNEYFSVEHSTDGRNFESIDIVQGALNSNVMQYYSYEHKDAINGDNYYRLRQVNTDGTFSFSPIEVVRLKGELEIKVLPTMADDFITLGINDVLDNDVDVEIYDILGRLVIAQTLGRGNLQMEVSVNSLQKGHYFVRINNGSQTKVARFIKR